MKIGIVYLGRHGSGGSLGYQLATHLSACADVFAVVSKFADELPMWCQSGLPLVQVDTYTSKQKAVFSLLDLPRHARLQASIERFSPDVLYLPMTFVWAPMVLWRLRKIPAVVTLHDPVPHPGIAGWAGSQVERLSARLAARCVVLSASLAPALEQWGIPRENIDVIPHGELASYYSARSTNAVRQSAEPTILFFGRITPYKGLDVLLSAFERIEQETPARLLMVGSGDLRPYRDQIGRLTRIQVVNQYVPDEEIEYYYRQADLLVAPYTSATQSGVIALANGFGVPVIASNTGGLSEQIEHAKTGILVEPGSVQELTKWCLRLINDRELARRLANAAKSRTENELGWDRIAHQVLSSCQQAAQAHRKPA